MSQSNRRLGKVPREASYAPPPLRHPMNGPTSLSTRTSSSTAFIFSQYHPFWSAIPGSSNVISCTRNIMFISGMSKPSSHFARGYVAGTKDIARHPKNRSFRCCDRPCCRRITERAILHSRRTASSTCVAVGSSGNIAEEWVPSRSHVLSEQARLIRMRFACAWLGHQTLLQCPRRR
jgi:hypothetical protein